MGQRARGTCSALIENRGVNGEDLGVGDTEEKEAYYGVKS